VETVTDTRDRVAARVRADPGVHFNELVRALDLAPGQVQYHLRRLEWVVEADLYGQTHYFPPGYDADERRALALLRRETAADVVAVLLEAEPEALAATAVTERVGIARSTLSWHLDRLTEAGLVGEERDAHNRVVLSLADPERTARLLRRAEPSTPERLVDRFTRLVDSLLAE
jgi:predicted transcriptional regulator